LLALPHGLAFGRVEYLPGDVAGGHRLAKGRALSAMPTVILALAERTDALALAAGRIVKSADDYLLAPP
jgi:predicted ABC-type transport system involved in lysophospholipase L1 biosynthesis ATPase subunit